MGFFDDVCEFFSDKLDEAKEAIADSICEFCDDRIRDCDNVILLLTSEEEAEKEGYSLAAKEYTIVYEKLEKDYDILIKNIQIKKDHDNAEMNRKLYDLEKLEKKYEKIKTQLENKIKYDIDKTSKKLNIGQSTLKSALENFTNIAPWDINDDIFSNIVDKKRKKIEKARSKGYTKARKIYEEKIFKLQEKMNAAKKSAEKDFKEFANLLSDVMEEIVSISTKIADLKLICGEDN